MLNTTVLFLTLFVSKFFAALLLIEVFLRFPDTMTILKLIMILRRRLASAVVLFLVMIYFFALFAYLFTPIADAYGDVCKNFLSCFSVFMDSTMRTMVSSTSPLFNAVYKTYGP